MTKKCKWLIMKIPETNFVVETMGLRTGWVDLFHAQDRIQDIVPLYVILGCVSLRFKINQFFPPVLVCVSQILLIFYIFRRFRLTFRLLGGSGHFFITPSWFSPFYPRVFVYVHVNVNVFTGTSSFYYSSFLHDRTARIIHRVFTLIFVLTSQGKKSNFTCSS